jgi:L-ribulose-5-phosphate 4-epimerase
MDKNVEPHTDLSGAAGAEARLRQEVAAATLMLNSMDILEYSGHISARLPGKAVFLIQPMDLSRVEVAPEALLLCDLSGSVVQGREKPPGEVFIHSEIYRAREDVGAIAHFHFDIATAFTLVHDAPLVPFKNHALRWASGIPTHPDPGHVNSPELGRGLATTLGPHHAAQIRGHGQVVTAESPRAVFVDCVHFAENAEVAWRAAAIGKVKPLTKAEIAAFSKTLKRDQHTDRLWQYYVRGAIAKGLIPERWSLLTP